MSRHNHAQSGYTLVEMIIVTGVFGIVLLLLANFAISGMNSYNYLTAQTNTSTDLNNQIGRVSRVIRGTTAVVSAGQNDLTIYGYFSPRDTAADKIHYYITGGSTLMVDVIPASGTAPNYTYLVGDLKSYVITTKLTVAPSPVFTYYDDLGNQLSGAFLTSQVKQIGILLSANPNPNRLPVPITISTRVTLRNMKTNL
jgi:prepilin-type N-terminal cleavage/methylation domain-containing protein